jgi:hypothetical protein
MRLITYLYFLLRLQISAVVTVLPLMSSWCTQGQLYLLPLFWRNDSIVYVDVILFHTKRGQCGVMEQCVIVQYCVVSKQNVVI